MRCDWRSACNGLVHPTRTRLDQRPGRRWWAVESHTATKRRTMHSARRMVCGMRVVGVVAIGTNAQRLRKQFTPRRPRGCLRRVHARSHHPAHKEQEQRGAKVAAKHHRLRTALVRRPVAGKDQWARTQRYLREAGFLTAFVVAFLTTDFTAFLTAAFFATTFFATAF